MTGRQRVIPQDHLSAVDNIATNGGQEEQTEGHTNKHTNTQTHTHTQRETVIGAVSTNLSLPSTVQCSTSPSGGANPRTQYKVPPDSSYLPARDTFN